jgi:hypothetical protein
MLSAPIWFSVSNVAAAGAQAATCCRRLPKRMPKEGKFALTHPWREPDSNHQSRPATGAGFTGSLAYSNFVSSVLKKSC